MQNLKIFLLTVKGTLNLTAALVIVGLLALRRVSHHAAFLSFVGIVIYLLVAYWTTGSASFLIAACVCMKAWDCIRAQLTYYAETAFDARLIC